MRHNQGFTVIQVLISTVVVVGIALTTITSISNIQKNQSRTISSASRDSLIVNLTFNTSNPLALYKSAVFNSEVLGRHQLAACVCGESKCLTVDTPFNLLDVGDDVIAGTHASAKKYDARGNWCENPPCSFEAFSFFSCVGSQCGTSTINSTSPILKVSYKLALTEEGKQRYNEFSYLKEVSNTVDVPVEAARQYGLANDFCVSGNSVSPTYGLSSGGAAVTIQGTGLQRVAQVVFDGSVCSIVSQSGKSLQCITSSHPDGYVDVTLKYRSGETFVIKNSFQYYTPPPPPPPPPPSLDYGTWKTTGPVYGPCCSYPPEPCVLGETRDFGHGSPSVCQ